MVEIVLEVADVERLVLLLLDAKQDRDTCDMLDMLRDMLCRAREAELDAVSILNGTKRYR